MTAIEDRYRTGRQLVAAALKVALAEAEMQGNPNRGAKADEQLALAARNHVRAVDALPLLRQPKGWRTEGSGPVLVLMCPECRKGGVHHHECDGSPCECPACGSEGAEGMAS